MKDVPEGSFGCCADEPPQDQSVTAIAEATGKSVFEVLYDQMNEQNGYGMTWRPLESYVSAPGFASALPKPQNRTRCGAGRW